MSFFPEFPQDYTAPVDVQRQLREVAPDVELLYMGWGRWYLMRYKPNRDLKATAAQRLGEANRLLYEWETGTKYKTNPGAFRRLYGRQVFWKAATMGARPIAEYPRSFIRAQGFAGIVSDLRFMEYMLRTIPQYDQDHIDEVVSADKEAERAAAAADLASPYRAMDAYRYVTTRTHSVTRHDNPHKRRARSGFTTVRTLGADGIPRRQA